VCCRHDQGRDDRDRRSSRRHGMYIRTVM
jgi:hypothetical protein